MASESSKPPRRKHKLEPITVEELLETSNMSGFLSFLDMKPGQSISLPHLSEREPPSAPETSAPESGAPETSALEISAPETSAPESGAPPGLQTPTASRPPELDLVSPSPRPRRVRVREALTVQDGHSLGEQAVYESMYRYARPHEGDEIRILTIGYRMLAERTRMAYSNCKTNVRSLIEKLAVEPVGEFSYTEGTTFLVYGYREVLRRRRAAGLTHVSRHRGIVFVDPTTGRELTGRKKGETSAPETSALVSGKNVESSALESVKSSALESGALSLDKISRGKGTTSSSSAADLLPPVLRVLYQFIPAVDDAAATRLIQACLDRAPDATIEELIEFISLKAAQVLRSPEVRNPMGLLQAAVPRCFEGESFRLYREVRQREKEAQKAQEAQTKAIWEAILDDPQADEETKQLARQALGL